MRLPSTVLACAVKHAHEACQLFSTGQKYPHQPITFSHSPLSVLPYSSLPTILVLGSCGGDLGRGRQQQAARIERDDVDPEDTSPVGACGAGGRAPSRAVHVQLGGGGRPWDSTHALPHRQPPGQMRQQASSGRSHPVPRRRRIAVRRWPAQLRLAQQPTALLGARSSKLLCCLPILLQI